MRLPLRLSLILPASQPCPTHHLLSLWWLFGSHHAWLSSLYHLPGKMPPTLYHPHLSSSQILWVPVTGWPIQHLFACPLLLWQVLDDCLPPTEITVVHPAMTWLQLYQLSTHLSLLTPTFLSVLLFMLPRDVWMLTSLFTRRTGRHLLIPPLSTHMVLFLFLVHPQLCCLGLINWS